MRLKITILQEEEKKITESVNDYDEDDEDVASGIKVAVETKDFKEIKLGKD